MSASLNRLRLRPQQTRKAGNRGDRPRDRIRALWKHAEEPGPVGRRTPRRETIGGAAVASRIVPCTWFGSIDAAVRAIRETSPELVVMLGEYGGRAMITVERSRGQSERLDPLRAKDNQGVELQGVPRREGLISKEHFTVDGTLIEAWTSMKSVRPKDEKPEDRPPPLLSPI